VTIAGTGATILAPGLLRFVGPVGAAAAVIQWLASLIEKHRIKATVQEHVDRAEQRRVNG
jgi:hypothetical protein